MRCHCRQAWVTRSILSPNSLKKSILPNSPKLPTVSHNENRKEVIVDSKHSGRFKVNLTAILASFLTAACLVFAACTKSAQPNATSSPSPALLKSPELPTKSAETQPRATNSPVNPPTAAEVKASLERVYKQVVVPVGDPIAFAVAGDFNGDGSEDIAVAVSPAKDALAEINSEFANWILADPKRVATFDPKKRVQSLPAQSGPPRVESGDSLLAIVHGYGPKGWRDRDATQSYLLKNAAGTGMRVMPLKNYPPALKVMERGAKSRADVLIQNLGGKTGFLYWAAGKYAWHEQ